jgi:hypothetical protein
MEIAGTLVDSVIENIHTADQDSFELNQSFAEQIKHRIVGLCGRFNLA